MNAIDLLTADHRAVEALLKDVQNLSENAHANRRKLFERIDQELTVHSKIEETIFYPALKAKAALKSDEDTTQEVLEAYEEHANVKGMLKKLEKTEAVDETYDAKLQVLGELVKHHVHEEEHQMFKEARRLMDNTELERLGEELAVAKEHLSAIPA